MESLKNVFGFGRGNGDSN